jgi:NitT/TauT family transport system substrate-binding protein
MLQLLAAAPVAAAAPARAQSIKLRIGAAATESQAEPLYALDSGFYARAGIDADISLFTTGSQITNALVGGALDVGQADILQVAQAVSRNVPLAFFAGGMQYVSEAPTTVLCAAKDGPVHGAKDLEGQTLAVYGLRSAAEAYVREWLAQNGADPAKVRFVEIPPAATAAAIGRGTVTAAIVSEPVLVTVRDTLRIVAKPYDACAKRFYINSWFSSREWLSKNADVARRLVQANYETARWANSHHDETAPILAKYTKLEAATIRAMTRGFYDTTLDPKLMQPVLDVAVKYKLLDRPLAAADISAKV